MNATIVSMVNSVLYRPLPVERPAGHQLGLAFGVLAGVAAVANVVPARRAAGVDPMEELRGD